MKPTKGVIMSSKLAVFVGKFLYEIFAWMIAVFFVNLATAIVKGLYRIVRNKIATFRKTELAPAK